MNRSLLLSTFTLGAIVIAGNASANLITFDDGQPNGTAIGSFYAGQGVTFSNAKWSNNFGLLGSSGTQAAVSVSDGFQVPAASPIVATFSSTVSSATLRGIDVGYQGFRLKAYNSSNILIDNQVIFGTDAGADQFYDLTVNGAIARIEFSQGIPPVDQDTLDGIAFENLSFTAAPVPEPATMATLGLGALALVRKRRAKK